MLNLRFYFLFIFFAASLIFFSLSDGYAQQNQSQSHPYSLTQFFSNEETLVMNNALKTPLLSRTSSHVIEKSNDITSLKMSCDEVVKQLDLHFLNEITQDSSLFLYNIYVFCGYDPKTLLATQFILKMVFDPLTDEAVTIQEEYIKSHQQREILGTVFQIQTVEKVIMPITLQMGIKKDSYDSKWILLGQMKSAKIFKTYLDSIAFNIDTKKRFYTQDQVLDFLAQWFPTTSLPIARYTLPNSTYAEIDPDRIFLLEGQNDPFIPLAMYYANYCAQRFSNGRCL